MQFRTKNGAIHEQIALLRANQIARITSDFKMGVIKLWIIRICIMIIIIIINNDYIVLPYWKTNAGQLKSKTYSILIPAFFF